MVVDTLPASSTATMLPRIYRDDHRHPAASYFESLSTPARAPSLVITMQGIPQDQRPPIVMHVERELNRLWRLPARWDGRRAAQMTLVAAQRAVNVLSELIGEDSPPPQIFPLPDGGVQVEWLVAGNSIEIEVEGDGGTLILATDAAGIVVAEGELEGEDREAVVAATRDFLNRLTILWRDGANRAA